ncbi:hypothetical protein F4860DRAFT_459918 [Xylaria cubensis]|nr:hypothetical protein F4860DRAFT_459918 [Xylaria cubensis]
MAISTVTPCFVYAWVIGFKHFCIGNVDCYLHTLPMGVHMELHICAIVIPSSWIGLIMIIFKHIKTFQLAFKVGSEILPILNL